MQQNLYFHEFRQEELASGEYTETFFKTWKGGGVFGLINIQNSEIDLQRVGSMLSQSAIDLIMNSVEENRIRLIESILRELNKTYVNTVKSEGSSLENSQIEIAMLLFLEDVVYVGMLGKVCSFVDRKGKILNFSKINQKESDLNVVSGKKELDDIYILSTNPIEGIEKGLQNNLSLFVSNDSLLVSSNEITLNNLLDDVEKFVSESDGELEEVIDNDLAVEDDDEQDVAVDENITKIEEETVEDLEVSTILEEPVVMENLEDEEQEILEDEIQPSFSEEANDDESLVDNLSEVNEGVLKSSKFKVLISTISSKIFPQIKKVGGGLFRFLGKVCSWIFETIVGFGSRTRFKTESSNNLKKRRIFLLLLIIILGGGLFFSIRWIGQKNNEKKTLESYNTEFARIEKLIEDANSKISYDETAALNLISDANKAAVELGKLSVENNKYQELLTKSQNLTDIIEKVVRLTNPEVVTDLKIWFENAEPSDILWFDGVVWVADSVSNSVFTVSTDGSTPKKVLDRESGLKAPKFLEKVNDKLFLWDNELGLFTITKDGESYKATAVVGLNKTTLGNVTEFSSYDSDGSLYFLIAEEGKIKKSNPVGTGYAYPQVRLENDVFKNTKDIEINGLIYTLGNGELVRYYGSDRDNNLEMGVVSPTISTETNSFDLLASLKIVILDKTNKRVVVYDQPDGSSSLFKLDKQYTMAKGETRFFDDLREVTIDLSTNTVYILDGGRIIKFGLNE